MHAMLTNPCLRVPLALPQPMEQLIEQVRGAAQTAAAAAGRAVRAAEAAARGLWAKVTAGRRREPGQQQEL